eukprot:30205-Prymnesium_polylepis.1
MHVHAIPATLHVVASVRAIVSHSPAAALSRTYVKRAVHALVRMLNEPFMHASLVCLVRMLNEPFTQTILARSLGGHGLWPMVCRKAVLKRYAALRCLWHGVGVVERYNW